MKKKTENYVYLKGINDRKVALYARRSIRAPYELIKIFDGKIDPEEFRSIKEAYESTRPTII